MKRVFHRLRSIVQSEEDIHLILMLIILLAASAVTLLAALFKIH